MQRKKLIVAIFALFLAFSFLGLPVPEWLASAVNSLTGTITAIVAGFSNLIAFVQFFARF